MDRLDPTLLFANPVDEGSFAVAARRHGRLPATVTRAVTLLEHYAGETLLLRSTRKLSLTAAGERHLAIWRDVLARLREMASHSDHAQSFPERDVRDGASFCSHTNSLYAPVHRSGQAFGPATKRVAHLRGTMSNHPARSARANPETTKGQWPSMMSRGAYSSDPLPTWPRAHPAAGGAPAPIS